MLDSAAPIPVPWPGCALFLDFDGTLAAIAPRPQDVRVEPWLVPALARARDQLSGALAIVSGRPLGELDAFLAPLRLPAAGVHGVERRDAQGRLHLEGSVPPPQAVLAAELLVEQHPELLIERKPSALALHYRAAPGLGPLCDQVLREAVRGHAEWCVLTGKCVVELRPRGASKARVVSQFMADEPFASRVPIFVGDDVTDEDGFVAVQAAGGVGIKVGAGSSSARHRLADTEAVREWLTRACEGEPPRTRGIQSAPTSARRAR